MKIDSPSVRIRPSMLPYVSAGIPLSLLSTLQFQAVYRAMLSMGLTPLLPEAPAIALSLSLFLCFPFFRVMTLYSIRDGSVIVELVPFRRTAVPATALASVRIERHALDTIMGTECVSFVAAGGRVLLRWQFVRLSGQARRELRRLSILLSLLGSQWEGRDANKALHPR